MAIYGISSLCRSFELLCQARLVINMMVFSNTGTLDQHTSLAQDPRDKGTQTQGYGGKWRRGRSPGKSCGTVRTKLYDQGCVRRLAISLELQPVVAKTPHALSVQLEQHWNTFFWAARPTWFKSVTPDSTARFYKKTAYECQDPSSTTTFVRQGKYQARLATSRPKCWRANLLHATGSRFQVDMWNMFANIFLFIHQSETFGAVLVSTWWIQVQHLLSFTSVLVFITPRETCQSQSQSQLFTLYGVDTVFFHWAVTHQVIKWNTHTQI